MTKIVKKSSRILKGKIQLPSSKSESARLLIIEAIVGKEQLSIKNLSKSTDTSTLRSSLESLMSLHKTNISLNIDVNDSGTAMRFITAFAAGIKVKSFITGTARMRQRPLGELVEKLNELGAKVTYIEKEAYPPILVEGKKLKGGAVEIDASISSQFISALLLIAPTMSKGIEIKLMGDIGSAPYIEMTIKIMRDFGIHVEQQGRLISVKKQSYLKNMEYQVESDWSAASYWYQMAAFSDEVDIHLLGLKKDSTQGDSIIAEWAKVFGVESTFDDEGVHLKKSKTIEKALKIDFQAYPDLAQTIITAAAGLKIPGEFVGLKSLRLKETDRIDALVCELSALGADITSDGDQINLGVSDLKATRKVNVYSDHRMAMAFAPLSLCLGEIRIDSPAVVAKSYPHFWEDLERVGFELEEI